MWPPRGFPSQIDGQSAYPPVYITTGQSLTLDWVGSGQVPHLRCVHCHWGTHWQADAAGWHDPPRRVPSQPWRRSWLPKVGSFCKQSSCEMATSWHLHTTALVCSAFNTAGPGLVYPVGTSGTYTFNTTSPGTPEVSELCCCVPWPFRVADRGQLRRRVQLGLPSGDALQDGHAAPGVLAAPLPAAKIRLLLASSSASLSSTPCSQLPLSARPRLLLHLSKPLRAT